MGLSRTEASQGDERAGQARGGKREQTWCRGGARKSPPRLAAAGCSDGVTRCPGARSGDRLDLDVEDERGVRWDVALAREAVGQRRRDGDDALATDLHA